MSNSKHIMYPFRIVNYCTPEKYINKIKGYMGAYCPACYNPMIFRASITNNIQHPDKEDNSMIWMKNIFYFECNKCHQKFTVEGDPLDPNITPMIAELNRKGYITVQSCEGNRVNDQMVSLPYILFKYPEQKAVTSYVPLQGPWHVSDNDEDKERFVIRCDNVDVPIRERMAWLRRWVCALPYCFEDHFTEDMFTQETKDSIEYQNLSKPLDEEDITDLENQQNPENDYTEFIEDKEKKINRSIYSSVKEVKEHHTSEEEKERLEKKKAAKEERKRRAAERKQRKAEQSARDKARYQAQIAAANPNGYGGFQKKNSPHNGDYMGSKSYRKTHPVAAESYERNYHGPREDDEDRRYDRRNNGNNRRPYNDNNRNNNHTVSSRGGYSNNRGGYNNRNNGGYNNSRGSYNNNGRSYNNYGGNQYGNPKKYTIYNGNENFHRNNNDDTSDE